MIHFYLNDQRIDVSGIAPTTTLLNYLRDTLALTGTKEGCAEGDCGACTVAMTEVNLDGTVQMRAINSCLLLVASLHGKRVYTVEGLSKSKSLHPVQQAMVNELGSQCGYCTPGIVMSMFAACYRNDITDEWQIDDQMCGNLCRCTGYRPIRDAAIKTAGTCPTDSFSVQIENHKPTYESISFNRNDHYFYMPTTFDELWEIMGQHPKYRLVSGATDLGLEITKRRQKYDCLISLEGLTEMKQIETTEAGWRIGGFVPLSSAELYFQHKLPTLTRMLRYFGARQIKNRATFGGNLCNASPIGDTPPVLMALNAEVILLSKQGQRRLPLSEFFISYRQTALNNGEILAFIDVPSPDTDAFYASYKVSKRRELDISAISASMRVRLNENGTIEDICLAYGGMAATPKRATLTEKALLNKPWTMESIETVKATLFTDFQPLNDQRASAWFRNKLAFNLLIGFFEEHRLKYSVSTETLPRKHAGTVYVLEST